MLACYNYYRLTTGNDGRAGKRKRERERERTGKEAAASSGNLPLLVHTCHMDGAHADASKMFTTTRLLSCISKTIFLYLP